MDDTAQAVLFGQIRTALAAIGGALVTQGIVSSGTVNIVLGVGTALIPVIWSAWSKYNTATKTAVKVEAAVNTGIAAAASGQVGDTVRPVDVPALIEKFAPPVVQPTQGDSPS